MNEYVKAQLIIMLLTLAVIFGITFGITALILWLLGVGSILKYATIITLGFFVVMLVFK